jgi:PhnB protein
MANNVKPIPEGFHTITPYIASQGTAKLMDFLKQAFGAAEIERHARPDGTIQHAQMKIGDSMLMMGDAQEPWTPAPATFYMYLEEVDATYQRAMEAGGVSLGEPKDQFYGDRIGGVKDPSGNQWWLATHKEDVSPEEMARRAKAAQG